MLKLRLSAAVHVVSLLFRLKDLLKYEINIAVLLTCFGLLEGTLACFQSMCQYFVL